MSETIKTLASRVSKILRSHLVASMLSGVAGVVAQAAVGCGEVTTILFYTVLMPAIMMSRDE